MVWQPTTSKASGIVTCNDTLRPLPTVAGGRTMRLAARTPQSYPRSPVLPWPQAARGPSNHREGEQERAKGRSAGQGDHLDEAAAPTGRIPTALSGQSGDDGDDSSAAPYSDARKASRSSR